MAVVVLLQLVTQHMHTFLTLMTRWAIILYCSLLTTIWNVTFWMIPFRKPPPWPKHRKRYHGHRRNTNNWNLSPCRRRKSKRGRLMILLGLTATIQAYQSKDMTHTSRNSFETSSFAVAIDTYASKAMTNQLSLMQGPTKKVSVPIAGIKGSSTALYMGTMKLSKTE